MRVYIKDVPTIYRDFFNDKIEFSADSREEAEDVLMNLQRLADKKLNAALENGNISQADWDNAPTYATLAKFEEEDEEDELLARLERIANAPTYETLAEIEEAEKDEEEEPHKLELTEKDIETIKKGGPAPFTIQDLAEAQEMSVKDYAKAHGIRPDTARGWSAGRPVKPFILAALYFWDKSAGILR